MKCYETSQSLLLLLLISSSSSLALFTSPLDVAYGDPWRQGPLNAGDYFEYDLCKNNHRNEMKCFNIYFNVVDTVHTDISDYYIINADIIQNNQSSLRVFLVDADTFEIKDADHVDSYASDISDTIFWLGKLSKEIKLEPGQEIARLDSYLPDDVPVTVRGASYDGIDGDFIVSYAVFETSNIIINQNMPLATSAKVYSPLHVVPEPRLMFSFDLVDHSEFKANSPDHYSNNDSNFGKSSEGILGNAHDEGLVDGNLDGSFGDDAKATAADNNSNNNTRTPLKNDDKKILIANYVRHWPK